MFRSSEYGVYYQGRSGVSVFGSILVENQIGVFTMVNGPSALAHELGKGVCFVEECVIVGRVGNDSECRWSRSGDRPIMEAFGAGQNGTGMIGVVWASFVSYGNGGPVLSWSSSRSYSQISGDMRVSYTTFAHFSPRYVWLYRINRSHQLVVKSTILIKRIFLFWTGTQTNWFV